MRPLSVWISSLSACWITSNVGCAFDDGDDGTNNLGEDIQEIKNGYYYNPEPWRAVRLFNGGCSGTMINDHWALTAAHCLQGNKEPTGRTVEYKGEARMATNILPHPKSSGFLPDPNEWIDVALVKVASPFSTLPSGDADLYTGDTDALFSTTALCLGYGAVNVYGSCTSNSQCNTGDVCQWDVCLTPNTTPNWARAGYFVIEPYTPNMNKYYELQVPNDLGMIPLPGDSGSACWTYDSSVITGIASSGNPTNYTRYMSGEAIGVWANTQRNCAGYDVNHPQTGYCSSTCRCDVGEGDCDATSQCRSGLVCTFDNGNQHGLPADWDVCVKSSLCPVFDASTPDPTYCGSNLGCPCSVGEGDCDDDFDCGGSLVCKQDMGAAVGLPAYYDICDLPKQPGCEQYSLSTASLYFCTTACPCGLGQGHCENNLECRPGLVCGTDNGASFGLPSNWDACYKP